MNLMPPLLQQIANRLTSKIKRPRVERWKQVYYNEYSHWLVVTPRQNNQFTNP